MENLIFTNATLLRANKCKKSFYLNLHYPELRDEVKENYQSVLESRKIIAKLLNHLFPRGKYAGIDVTGSCEMSYVLTKDILNTDSETIFNACFKCGDIFCFVDVLQKDKNQWNVFEIWEDNDSGDNVYLTAAYQQYIIQKCGVKVGNYSSIIYKSKRNDENIIDLSYEINPLDNQIKDLKKSLQSNLKEIKKIAKQETIPEIIQGIQCTDPKQCDFYNYCKFSSSN